MTRDELIQTISDGFEKAKAGDAIATYKSILPYAEDGSMPYKSHYAFGWIIYYALHQSDKKEISERKHMLARYFKLSLTKPHKLHSMVLTEAINLYKDAKEMAYGKKESETVKFSIIKFANIWDLSNLRDGDWRRKEVDGTKVGSTVEKLITAYVDELEETATLPSDEFNAVMGKAMGQYSDSDNFLSQYATLCVMSGKQDEAAAILRKALLVAPGKFHLWAKLASLTPAKDNPHLHVALLYKGLLAPRQEKFKGRIRLSLADVLASREAFPQALFELKKVKEIYSQNEWHLPSKYETIGKMIPKDTVADNPEKLYRRVEYLADDEIYNALPEIEVTKTYHKIPSETDTRFRNNKIAWRLTDSNGHNFWINPGRMRINPDLPMGTRLKIRVFNGKAVKAKLSE